MDKHKTVITKEGLEKLQEEYDYLVHVENAQVIEELQAARAMGDLSENADYDAARDHQARVAARIKQLEAMLSNVEIIDVSKKGNKTVGVGTTVTIEYLDTHEQETYTIVGTTEADPLNGKLSNEAPLALALMDHKQNDTVQVMVNPSYKVKILEIVVK